MRHILLLLTLIAAGPVLGCEPDSIQSMTPASEAQLEALVTCLASPDFELRDQFAYTRLAGLLRDQRPPAERLEYLSAQLGELLQQPATHRSAGVTALRMAPTWPCNWP